MENSTPTLQLSGLSPTYCSFIHKVVGEVKLIVDFLAEPFGNRDPHYITRLGTCPVRFIGDEGWVETGDSGRIAVSLDSLRAELPAPTITGTSTSPTITSVASKFPDASVRPI